MKDMQEENPYAPPIESSLSSEEDLIESAKLRLSRPATALIIMSSIHSVFLAIPLISVFFVSWHAFSDPSYLFLLGMNAVQFAALIFIAIGGAKMGFLESSLLAKIGAYLACIPFISPFVVLGIPFGIWSLWLLRQPEIRTAFDLKE